MRLDPVVGSEQAGERPVLVISSDVINEHSNVILIAAITSKKTDRVYAYEAVVDPPEGGLTQKSKVMLTHIRSIDKSRINKRLGSVSDEVMEKVEKAIRVATGLIRY